MSSRFSLSPPCGQIGVWYLSNVPVAACPALVIPSSTEPRPSTWFLVQLPIWSGTQYGAPLSQHQTLTSMSVPDGASESSLRRMYSELACLSGCPYHAMPRQSCRGSLPLPLFASVQVDQTDSDQTLITHRPLAKVPALLFTSCRPTPSPPSMSLVFLLLPFRNTFWPVLSPSDFIFFLFTSFPPSHSLSTRTLLLP